MSPETVQLIALADRVRRESVQLRRQGEEGLRVTRELQERLTLERSEMREALRDSAQQLAESRLPG
jgi:hypothetical protein